ncbi:MAG: hypothetical protein JRH20_26510 [Deltaproteobacteria bacterium]|nr:hypothetical protein [Deltaproteobacteria bacterium]
MDFADAVEQHFPGSLDEGRFVEQTREVLGPFGFTAANTLAIVGVCRDELCRTLRLAVQRAWGEAFDITSLAGMVNCGHTGLKAAHRHAPIEEGRERYVYIVMAHIGIGEGGELGHSRRAGRPGLSSACGALSGVLAELQSGRVDTVLHWDDIEQSLLRRRLIDRLPWGATPNLAELTHTAHTLVREELEELIAVAADASKADYAIFTGIQIHGLNGEQLSWIHRPYAMVEGKRQELASKLTA